VLQTLNFATWWFGGFAPKKGWNPFTPSKLFVYYTSLDVPTDSSAHAIEYHPDGVNESVPLPFKGILPILQIDWTMAIQT
jgi:hypothetical protein